MDTGTAVVVALALAAALAVGVALGWSLRAARGDIGRHTDPNGVRETMAAVSAEALRRNSETFAALARSQLDAAGADAGVRHQAVQAMVAPLHETLSRVQNQLAEVERARVGSYATLMEQVASMRSTSEVLRTETSALVTALRAPQVRGRWGELQLERVVEAAGMSEHVDFSRQLSVTDEDGTARPDLVVHLVGGKSVVVDAKVAFSGYLQAMEARDEATRDDRLRAHARQLRRHIDALAAKAYWQRFSPSPEFVVCFVAADAFLDAALREDPELLEHAFAHDVVLATPSTLIALLRTVAYTWRQEALAANAAEVHQLGRQLYQRLATMGSHLDKVGRSLGSAVTSYNQSVASLESRVLVTARRFNDLQVVGQDQVLPAPQQLLLTPRSAPADEPPARAVGLG